MGLFGKKPAAKKPAVKSTEKKKPFGGYCINFGGRTETMEEVFGKKDITPSEMTKNIWAYVKGKDIAGKK